MTATAAQATQTIINAPGTAADRFSTRKFGVEIECINLNLDQARQALRAAGLTVEDTDRYTHVVTAGWKAVHDGSITGGRGGCEVVSPILSGEEGIEEVKKAAAALSAAGATINKSCGLHIHVDAADLNVITLKLLMRRYSRFQAIIDGFMPPSRRNGQYAKKMDDLINTPWFTNATTRDRLMEMDRYHAINLAALGRHGTVEFRQHSGSVDGTKISNWAKFCVAFVEQTKFLAAHLPGDVTQRITKAMYNKLWYRKHAATLFSIVPANDPIQPSRIIEWYQRDSSTTWTEADLQKVFVYMKKKYNIVWKKVTAKLRRTNSHFRYAPPGAVYMDSSERTGRPDGNDRHLELPTISPRAARTPRTTPVRTRDGLNPLRLFFMLKDASQNASGLGLSIQQITQAFGWSEATARAQLSELRRTYGVEMRHRRNSSWYRYQGLRYGFRQPERPDNVPTPGHVAAVQPQRRTARAQSVIMVANDSLWNGISPTIQSFYAERASDFAQPTP